MVRIPARTVSAHHISPALLSLDEAKRLGSLAPTFPPKDEAGAA